jgi:hypothetical protein
MNKATCHIPHIIPRENDFDFESSIEYQEDNLASEKNPAQCRLLSAVLSLSKITPKVLFIILNPFQKLTKES